MSKPITLFLYSLILVMFDQKLSIIVYFLVVFDQKLLKI